MPVIPATQEADAGELLESGSWRLQFAEIMPLCSSLVTERDSFSKIIIIIKIIGIDPFLRGLDRGKRLGGK